MSDKPIQVMPGRKFQYTNPKPFKETCRHCLYPRYRHVQNKCMYGPEYFEGLPCSECRVIFDEHARIWEHADGRRVHTMCGEDTFTDDAQYQEVKRP